MGEKVRVVFFGTPEFAARGLSAIFEMSNFEVPLVVTQPDKPSGRGGKIHASVVKQLAVSKNIPVYQPQRLKKELHQALNILAQHGPFDLGVVIAFGQILPQEILNVPKLGCVNVHASLLPRWRGAAPIQRSIISGDKETGICLMHMDAGLDTGPVYSSISTEISPNDTFQSLHDRLALIGAELLKTDLPKIANKDLHALPQPEAGVTYAEKITQQQAKINWQLPATQLHRLIMGLSPIPAAYCMLGGKRLKIFKSRVLDRGGSHAVPGSVCFTDKSRIEVACGDGVISIEEVQLEGKKRLPVSEFLKGVQINTSMVFN